MAWPSARTSGEILVRDHVEVGEGDLRALHVRSNYPDIYGPWFMVETPKGRIKIGWRKRVVNIDWSETGLTATGADVVDDPQVTHGPTFTHAWGAEKAVEALRKLWAQNTPQTE